MKRGGAGLFSTVKDYLKFTQMLANGGNYNGTQIIGRKTIDLMRRNMLNDVQLQDFRNSYLEGVRLWTGGEDDDGACRCRQSVRGRVRLDRRGRYLDLNRSLRSVSVVYMHQTDPNNEEYHHHRVGRSPTAVSNSNINIYERSEAVETLSPIASLLSNLSAGPCG